MAADICIFNQKKCAAFAPRGVGIALGRKKG
jgi:hypothetical protein